MSPNASCVVEVRLRRSRANFRNPCSLAREYGLELVHFSTFSDLFYHEKEVPEFAQLMRRMNVVNHQGESDMDLDEVGCLSLPVETSSDVVMDLPCSGKQQRFTLLSRSSRIRCSRA